MFFTRIPVPKFVKHSEDILNSAGSYLPFIGWIVGGASALVFLGSSFILPVSISVLLSIIASVIITGAFHEDGFADVCDGFGGGWTKEKILLIMKDSRVGAYGVIGIILLLLTKFTALSGLPLEQLPFLIVGGHVTSRMFAVSFIYFSNYARDDATSKTKPLGKKLRTPEYGFAVLVGLLPFLLLREYEYLLVLLPMLLTYIFFSRYIVKWIGGFTGDCLGAMQQLTEVVFYISALAVIRNLL